MTITDGYCTLDELKHTTRLNIASSDTDQDEMLEGVIESISRHIDDVTGRRFYSDTDEVPRYFTALHSTDLFVDDIASPSSDVTIETDTNGDGTFDDTWTAADFLLAPYNAEELGEPYQKIEVSDSGQFNFPKRVRKGVKVTAKWGWASVPKPIKQATLLQCERLYKRFATPLGSESLTALGRMTLSIPSLAPDVQQLISRYCKIDFG